MTIERLSATKLARRYNTSTAAVQDRLVRLGYIDLVSGIHYLTERGKNVGGEWVQSPGGSSADGHMVWPVDLPLMANTSERMSMGKFLWLWDCSMTLWRRGNMNLRTAVFWARKLEEQFGDRWSGTHAAQYQLDRWQD